MLLITCISQLHTYQMERDLILMTRKRLMKALLYVQGFLDYGLCSDSEFLWNKKEVFSKNATNNICLDCPKRFVDKIS